MRTTIALCLSIWLGIIATGSKSSDNADHAPSRTGQIESSYRPEKPSFVLHEPIVVNYTLHNGLTKPIILTLGMQNRQFFQFSLTTPDGQVVQSLPPAGWQVETVTFGNEGAASVPPVADHTQGLVMNQWFEFKAKGDYHLTARLTTDIRVPGGNSFAPEGGETQIHIGPRDADYLQRLCADLANQVVSASTAEQWREPALKLSYIEDPVAVPCLARVLEMHKGAEFLIIPGLERIGTDSAVEVLLTGLRDRHGDIAPRAETALRHMQDRITDPALKIRVRRALELRATASIDR